jgi:probable HAF family extracellular repeat protein
MLTRRRCTIVAGAVFGLVGLAIFLGTPVAGKGPSPPRPTATPYSITLLQPLVPNTSMRANAMNNSGDIVGLGRNAAGVQVGFLSTVENGVRVTYDLNDTLTPVDQTQWVLRSARDINDAGQIVGGGTLNGVAVGYRYTPEYMDEQGVFHPPVVEKTGDLGAATLIDPSGNNVLCEPGTLATYNPETDQWTTQDLERGGRSLSMYRVSGSGQVGGYAGFESTGTQHAMRYTPGVGVEDLGFLRYNKGHQGCSFGFDMDEQGQVVGLTSAGGDTYSSHAFRYTDALGMVDLGTLGGQSSQAHGINRLGTMIVGSSNTANGPDHVFLYTPAKGMVDLEAAIVNLPPEFSGHLGWSYLRVNNAGWVCGNTDVGTAFLLTPQ